MQKFKRKRWVYYINREAFQQYKGGDGVKQDTKEWLKDGAVVVICAAWFLLVYLYLA